MTTSASSSSSLDFSDAPAPSAFSLRRLWRAEFLSPKDLIKRAILITIVFTIAHLAGLKEFTTVLNGTMGSIQLGFGISAFLGLSYIFLYLALVLLVPILALAAAMLLAWKRF